MTALVKLWQHTTSILLESFECENCGCINLMGREYKLDLHLCGEHCDVMKLSTSSLFDRDSQEESAAIFGEHRFLVLQKAKMDELEATIT